MKNLPLFFSTVLFLLLSFSPASAQPKMCSKKLDNNQMNLSIRNATDKPLKVFFVDESCKEDSGKTIEPGRGIDMNTYEGYFYAVRDAATNAVVQAITVSFAVRRVTIGIVSRDNQRQGFLETANLVCKTRGLPPLVLDDTLNQSCQWLADQMAKFEKISHDAVEIGGKELSKMRKTNDRLKNFGWKTKKNFEAVQVNGITDPATAGSDFAATWMASDSHHFPFFALKGQNFTHVGFGLANSKTRPNRYYACAVFATPGGK